MKKALTLLFLLLSFFLFGCSESYKVKDDEYNYIKNYGTRTDGNFDAMIVNSAEEVEKCINEKTFNVMRNQEVLKEYDDAFFEEKSLIIVPWMTSSGGDYYKIISYKIIGNEIILKIKLTSKGNTCDLGRWFMLLEIDSSKIEGVDKIDLNVNE